jgi:hypothetical protein
MRETKRGRTERIKSFKKTIASLQFKSPKPHKHTSYRIPEHESGHVLCRCHEKTLPTGTPERDGRRRNGKMKTKGRNNNYSLNNQKTKGPNQGTQR